LKSVASSKLYDSQTRIAAAELLDEVPQGKGRPNKRDKVEGLQIYGHQALFSQAKSTSVQRSPQKIQRSKDHQQPEDDTFIVGHASMTFKPTLVSTIFRNFNIFS
jgi:hypothetical protein